MIGSYTHASEESRIDLVGPQPPEHRPRALDDREWVHPLRDAARDPERAEQRPGRLLGRGVGREIEAGEEDEVAETQKRCQGSDWAKGNVGEDGRAEGGLTQG